MIRPSRYGFGHLKLSYLFLKFTISVDEAKKCEISLIVTPREWHDWNFSYRLLEQFTTAELKEFLELLIRIDVAKLDARECLVGVLRD